MAAGVPLGWGVTPNSGQDEEWRSQVAGSYYYEPSPVVEVADFGIRLNVFTP